jgi:DNA polymerase-1
MSSSYIFDLETDGLLDDVTKIHCMVIKDIETGEATGYTGRGIWAEGIPKLEKADMIIGHNIIKYDIPVLKKLGTFNPKGEVCDTLVCTRLIWADVKQADFTRTDFPRKLIGSHSLAAWGHRLGNYKGDYDGGWEEYSDEMLEYCFQDVEVTYTLYGKIADKEYSRQALDLEHEVAELIFEQEVAGFAFDTESAGKLYAKLSARKLELETQLKETFPDWEVKTPFTPKVNNKKLGYEKGVPTYKVKQVQFNPGSRDHVANRLTTLRGWKPTDYTNDGKPKVDEMTLSKLPYPEAKLLVEYYTLIKRLGQLGDGRQAWLKVERGGRIHGSCNTNGAVTGRATHAYPNVAQVPSCGAPYGRECRELFTVPRGKKLVGVDVSGLELRCLAHYMARFDGGAYGEAVVNGDIHTTNQKAAGLAERSQAKTFIYGFLYGAGVGKLGEIVGKGGKEGTILKKRFLAKLPALATLIERVQKAAERGYIVGLDGRHLKVRSPHSALNVLLQSAGALICKQWMVEFNYALIEQGLKESCTQVAWVHDEIQLETKEDMSVECIKRAGDAFSIRCELDGEYNIGNNWAETH